MWGVHRSDDGGKVAEFGDKVAANICKNALEFETGDDYFVKRI